MNAIRRADDVVSAVNVVQTYLDGIGRVNVRLMAMTNHALLKPVSTYIERVRSSEHGGMLYCLNGYGIVGG